MDATAEDWIRMLKLLPHPEGGFYREVYRSSELLDAKKLPDRYGAARCMGTSIYYLLRAGDCSRFHRLKSDEIWHYHAGGSASLHLLTGDGGYEQRRIGANPLAGQEPQITIPHGCWFGATVDRGDYILVGCSVFPGFDFADFELAEAASLSRLYPSHQDVIRRLC